MTSTWLFRLANSSSICHETLHLSSWAAANNLHLNPSKTHELIVVPKYSRKSAVRPPLLPNVERVASMKIIEIIIQDNLSMGGQVEAVVSKGAESLFALRTLKCHGLSSPALASTCNAILVSHLIYAIPAWISFASETDRHRLQSFLSKASRWGLTGGNTPYSLGDLAAQSDKTPFSSVFNNPLQVFHQFLPLPTTYSLNRVLDLITFPSPNLASFALTILFTECY